MDILTFRLRAFAATVKAVTDNLATRIAVLETRPSISVGPSAPSSPRINDLWVDTN